MAKAEVINLADQMSIVFGQNYRSKVPFDLWFCNYQFDSLTHEKIANAIPNIMKPSSFVSLETKSYLDVMPKDKLVYLSPHAQEAYNKFDEEDILIIGAFIDKRCGKPVSLAKAKKEQIRMARLPIDENVAWGSATKRLTLNQVVDILLEVKLTSDWRESLLKHVPKRKLKTLEQIAEEDAYRKKKSQRQRKNFFTISSTN
jgi:ribonuclease P protein 1